MQNNQDIDLLMGIMQLMETVNDSMLKILDLLEKNFSATGAIYVKGVNSGETDWSASGGKLLQEAFVDLESSGLAEKNTETYEVVSFDGERVSTFDQPAYFDTDDLSEYETDDLQKDTEEYPGTEKF